MVLTQQQKSFSLHNVTVAASRGGNGGATFAHGAFGEITLAVRRLRDTNNTNKETHDRLDLVSLSLVAVKKIYLVVPPKEQRCTSDTTNMNNFLSEISCLQHLGQHPNIIRLLDAFTASGTTTGTANGGGQWWSMVLPYCPVDLYTVLEWKRCTLQPLLSYETVCRIANDLLAAIAHCHERDLVHGDVKPGNLLVHAESGTLQLCDFGIAQKQRVVKDPSAMITTPLRPTPATMETPTKHSNCGNSIWSNDCSHHHEQQRPRALCTLQYRPPELLLGLSATEYADSSLDMFSAGLTLAECVSGRMLFPGTSDLAQLSLYFHSLGTPSVESWPDVVTLPDWGKLSFATHPIDPLWYRSMLPRLCEFPNDDPVTGVIRNTIQLDPSKRWSAQKCHEHLAQQCRPSSLDANEEASCQARRDFVAEMVPVCLQTPPLLLSPPFDCFDEIDRQILHVAHRRREFINSLHPWTNIPKKASSGPS